MNVANGFSKLVNYALRFLFLIILGGSLGYLIKEAKSFPKSFSMMFAVISMGLFVGLFLALRKRVSHRVLFFGILGVGLVIRILWYLNIKSIPVSDFSTMYNSGKSFINGSVDMFWGTSYFACFPHMTLTVLSFGLMQSIFADPLHSIRLVNIALSMANIIAIYLMTKRVFPTKNKSIYAMLLAALYPPMIFYNNVFSSENFAMPLFLFSILIYLKGLDEGKGWFVISGLLLGMAHLFRPLGYVTLIGYLVYILIYHHKSLRAKAVTVVSIITSFLIPFVLASAILLNLGVIENPLWHGAEPPTISILKGTNFSSLGRWNEEDASVFWNLDGDYQRVDQEAKRIIKQRLTQTPKIDLIIFFVKKYSYQWLNGEFAGTFWAEAGLDNLENRHNYLPDLDSTQTGMLLRMSKQGIIYTQFFYVVLLLLTNIGLYRKNTLSNKKIDFFYILFCGFALQCLITEAQDRYAYPVSWLFILLAMTGLYLDQYTSQQALDSNEK